MHPRLFVVIKVKSCYGLALLKNFGKKMTSATEFLLKLTWILQESMTLTKTVENLNI